MNEKADAAATRRFLFLFGGGFLGIFALVGGILGWVFFFAGPMEHPGIDAALAVAKRDPNVVRSLGDRPEIYRTRGGFVEASVNAKINMTLSLRGPRGEAELEIIGFRLGKAPWEFTTLELRGPEGTFELASAE